MLVKIQSCHHLSDNSCWKSVGEFDRINALTLVKQRGKENIRGCK
jgi:hypothetical protein